MPPIDSRPSAPTPPTVHHRFETLAEALAVAILTAGADGSVEYANPAARELFWRTEEDLLGAGWLASAHPEDRDRLAASAHAVSTSGNADRTDFRIDVAGYTRWVRARFNPLPSDEGEDHGWVAIIDDVTADRATSDELERRAAEDPLTGLANRGLLHDRLDMAVARSRRSTGPLAVFFLDLDRFKPVNDRLGHQAGDQVLRVIGGRIRHATRADDTAARIGGDEFVVVAEGLSRDMAEVVARRLADAIGAPISVADEEVSLGVSIGVMWAFPPLLSSKVLIDRADQAMYQAKRTGQLVAFAGSSSAG